MRRRLPARRNVLGNAVAQVFVFFRAAQVLEIQHGHRFRRHTNPGLGIRQVRGAPGPRIQVALQTVQIRLKFSSGLAAQGAVFFQQFRQDAPELRGELRVKLVHRLGVAVQNRIENHRTCVAWER